VKIKGYNGRKRCPDGESYTFVNGVCKVPGIRMGHCKVKITLAEFNKLVEECNEEETVSKDDDGAL